MKKNVILAAVLLVLTGLMVYGQQKTDGTAGTNADAGDTAGKGGYKGPGTAPMFIIDAKVLNDNTPVILKGRIIQSLGEGKYNFADKSGKGILHIPDQAWGNLSVDQNDVMLIHGMVKRDFHGTEIVVGGMEKANP